MEIKTCEEYVLNQLKDVQEENEKLKININILEQVIRTQKELIKSIMEPEEDGYYTPRHTGGDR